MLVSCKTCKSSFNRKPSLLKKTKDVFCSRICYNCDRTVYNKCIVCEKKIPSRKGLTCSQQCAYLNRFGSRKKGHGQNKAKLRFAHEKRQEVIEKRGNRCECCNYDVVKVLVIHHILERAQGGTNENNNLLVLCPNCHAEIHKGLRKVNRQGGEPASKAVRTRKGLVFE